jgi:eukaryotic-like serine/threonine-protein kinase
MSRDLRRVLRGEPVTATPLLSDRETMIAQRTGVLAGVPVDDRTQAMAPVPVSSGRRGLVYALTILLFLGILVAVFALIFSLLTRNVANVVVPSVVGKSFSEAERILDEAGLEGRQAGTEPSDVFPAGQVISQDPADGLKIRKGEAVELTVSSGPPSGEVPDLVGKTEKEAEDALEASGLQKGTVKREFSAAVPEGRVISQDPAAGDSVQRGTKINYSVSSGKQKVKVPNVKGRSESEARDLLEEANLVPKIKNVCDPAQDNNKVLDQNPAPNTEVAEGSEVEISVNDTRRVPSVVTQSEASARADLEAAGFAVQVVQKDDIPGTQDKVTNQDPNSGNRGCAGSTVTITVEK